MLLEASRDVNWKSQEVWSLWVHTMAKTELLNGKNVGAFTSKLGHIGQIGSAV